MIGEVIEFSKDSIANPSCLLITVGLNTNVKTSRAIGMFLLYWFNLLSFGSAISYRSYYVPSDGRNRRMPVNGFKALNSSFFTISVSGGRP